MSQSVILCEGFHDRAFWSEWLRHLACSDQRFRPGPNGVRDRDPWGDPIGKGHFAFDSRSKAFIRIVPCGGKSNIIPAARNYLTWRHSQQLPRLVINVDPDTMAGSSVGVSGGLKLSDVLNLTQTFDPAASVNPDNEIELDGGATKVAVIRWEANDPPADGIPHQQTLERLICAALVAAYPDRAIPVKTWLDSRLGSPPAGHKEHAWSYMAGWYADHGCDDFFGHMWRDVKIASELESRLRAANAWRIVDALSA
jgi:hypothetical protein